MKGKIAIVSNGRHSLSTAIQLSEAYQQGRADGIDECINLIKMCCPSEEVSSFGLLVCGLEKLKEQKNEN